MVLEILQYIRIVIIKYNDISQYYCFYCIFEQIHTPFVTSYRHQPFEQ